MYDVHLPLAFFMGAPSPVEMAIVALIALLLFGKRLPEVARSMGKGIVEFKKGLSGIEDEVNRASSSSSDNYASSSPRPVAHDDQVEMTAPKFEPPTSTPHDSTDASHEEESTHA